MKVQFTKRNDLWSATATEVISFTSAGKKTKKEAESEAREGMKQLFPSLKAFRNSPKTNSQIG